MRKSIPYIKEHILNTKYFSLLILIIPVILLELLENVFDVENVILKLFVTVAIYLLAIFATLKFKTELPMKKIEALKSYELIVYSLLLIVGIFFILEWFTTLLIPYLVHPDYVDIMHYNIDFMQILEVIIIFPILEELLFRRIIAGELENQFGFLAAIIVSSVLFAYAHYNSDNSVFIAFIMGLILGYFYLKTHNFLLVLIAHSFVNGVVLFFSAWYKNKLVDYAFDNMQSSTYNGFLFWYFILSVAFTYSMFYVFRKHIKKLALK
jgi:membrane protease YdiL (CAAX protease family)